MHEVFIDMAVLIESQGELVDSIENHVKRSRSFVERSRPELKKAVRHQSRARYVSNIEYGFDTNHCHSAEKSILCRPLNSDGSWNRSIDK